MMHSPKISLPHIGKAQLASAARYAVLPGIIPRLRSLGFGFSYLAYMIALVFAAVRLLPLNHPFFRDARSINDLSVAAVFGEAAKHLVFSWKRIDQIFIFALLSIGMCLLLLQFFTFIGALLIPTAQAASFALNFIGMFEVYPPEKDIAFQLLDKTFAIPNLYNSSFDPNTWDKIPPFNKALFGLFKFYNTAMLLVALMIVFYFVIAIILETVETGTPFGKRFASVYVPMRIILAIALLLPINYGMSMGQHLTLHVAKWGSSLATNGWKIYNNKLIGQTTLLGGNSIAKPKPANLTAMVEFMHLASACRAAYAANPMDGVTTIDAYVVRTSGVDGSGNPVTPDSQLLSGLSYSAALQFNGNRSIQLVFGSKGQGNTAGYAGYVFPACGEMTLPIEAVNNVAAETVSAMYYDMVKAMWADNGLRSFGNRVAAGFLQTTSDPCTVPYTGSFNWGDCTTNKTPGAEYYRRAIDQYQAQANAALELAVQDLKADDALNLHMTQDTLDRGWGGAAMLYNDLALLNGTVITAVFATPTATRLPAIMRESFDLNRSQNAFATGPEMYDPGDGQAWTNKQKLPFAQMYFQLKSDFSQDSIENLFSNGGGTNPILRMFNFIFGSWGLMDLYENRDVHPLASMAALGRTLVESSIRNLGIGIGVALGGTGLGNMMGISDPAQLDGALRGIAGLFFTLFSVTLTAGFILYYIVPFMPFMYFFFSVMRWVRAIFEAMVAVPLWGIAHLRIDGDGIPGKAAANGYFLLLDIFLRPILTLFGFIAAIAIFSALAVTLHDVFKLALGNMTGFTASNYDFSKNASAMNSSIDEFRSYIDQFFFTVTYAVLMYIMASSTFKIIDGIPNNTLRFIGAGVQSFSDTNEDPAQTLVQYGAIASSQMIGEIGNDLKEQSFGLAAMFRPGNNNPGGDGGAGGGDAPAEGAPPPRQN